MKTLCILCLLLFASLSVRGAGNIRTSEFPITNRVNSSDRVVGVVPSLGTNATQSFPIADLFSWGLRQVDATNSIYFTNQCYVNYGVDTNNTLSLSNAGLSAVNGIYRTNNFDGYTNGIYKIAWATSFGGYVLSNATVIVYGFDEFGSPLIGDGTLWGYDALGNPPAPMSWWGPVTNCFTVLASSAGIPAPTVSSNLYVDATIGNDTNALRGRIDRPWRNLQAALLNQRPGDTILLGPGNYPPLGSVNYDISNRVSLKGAGRGITFIGTAGAPDESLRCGSEVKLQDFTSYGLLNVGSLGITSTNVVAERCEFNASADAVYLFAWETTFTLRDCDLFTDYDGLADWENRPGGSNRVARLYNCNIRGRNGHINGILQGITCGDSRIEMFGGSIDVEHASGRNHCVTVDVDVLRTNKTGSVLLSNVRLRSAATNNASASFVTNFYRLPVVLDNCTAEDVTPVLVAGVYTNSWSDRLIAIPNGSVRTNRLVDTRAPTNALMQVGFQGHRVTVYDAGGTASGTNIFILTTGNQKMNQQTITNITTDYGSMTFFVKGTNWEILAKQ